MGKFAVADALVAYCKEQEACRRGGADGGKFAAIAGGRVEQHPLGEGGVYDAHRPAPLVSLEPKLHVNAYTYPRLSQMGWLIGRSMLRSG